MDYPSTTQALFALIIMIIMLAFILVYCCWGTFNCHSTSRGTTGSGAGSESDDRESPNPAALVILPYHSMIYIGDSQTQQVYQIPMREDKPPSYRDIFSNLPALPPSYLAPAGPSEPPPAYEECVPTLDSWMSSSMMSTTSAVQSRVGSDTISSASSSSPPPLPSVLRARSLLTVMGLGSVLCGQRSIGQLQSIQRSRLAPAVTSAALTNARPPPTSRPLADSSFGSFTASSSPCLPSNFKASSNSPE